VGVDVDFDVDVDVDVDADVGVDVDVVHSYFYHVMTEYRSSLMEMNCAAVLVHVLVHVHVTVQRQMLGREIVPRQNYCVRDEYEYEYVYKQVLPSLPLLLMMV